MNSYILKIFLILTAITCTQDFSFTQKNSVKVLDINVWSGLTYKGNLKMGEYETEKKREMRFRTLLEQIRSKDPDVILVQEANPVSKYASKLADELDYDEIHFVCNAGIKLGPLGIPSNLSEGQVILAKHKLNLEEYDIWKHSGSLGINSEYLNIHFDESIYSLVGKIKINGKPVFIVNTHLYSVIPMDSSLKPVLQNLYKQGKITRDEYSDVYSEWRDMVERQENEMQDLLKKIKELPADVPVIAGGDFNSATNSELIKYFERAGRFINTLPLGNRNKKYTWDMQKNSNSMYEFYYDQSHTHDFDIYDSISAYYDETPRSIDHIFLDKHFARKDIISSEVTLDSTIHGVQASDHFGVLTEIDMSNALDKVPVETDEIEHLENMKIEALPILTYDSDAGFGYGAKVFALNPLKSNESFDAVVFNSTKGERWYRFVFSIPDFELRQGKNYPFSLDFIVDYDKWNKNNFYGIGNNSSYENAEVYQKEPLETSVTAGRTFTKNIITQAGFKYKTIRNFGFSENSKLAALPPGLNKGRVSFGSIFFTLRYDTRNSFVNPSRGVVLQAEGEYAPKLRLNNVNFTSLGGWVQYYNTLFYPKTVLALRFGLHSATGENLPVQTLLSLGGNSSLRGYSSDRFMDKTAALFNAELRFPIYWRFGGVLGFDAGKVWSSVSKFDIKRWASNPAAGLRFYMNTFVIRLDIGFGKETTGIYFNFGQTF
jgi:endonuclease/exonuclease/phosphatase family metal-dependent hydrolase